MRRRVFLYRAVAPRGCTSSLAPWKCAGVSVCQRHLPKRKRRGQYSALCVLNVSSRASRAAASHTDTTCRPTSDETSCFDCCDEFSFPLEIVTFKNRRRLCIVTLKAMHICYLFRTS
jgi:hypothetical protein